MSESSSTTQVDLSHMSYDDLVNFRRHLRALLILVEQMMRLTKPG
jgi:hypothetical protein